MRRKWSMRTRRTFRRKFKLEAMNLVTARAAIVCCVHQPNSQSKADLSRISPQARPGSWSAPAECSVLTGIDVQSNRNPQSDAKVLKMIYAQLVTFFFSATAVLFNSTGKAQNNPEGGFRAE